METFYKLFFLAMLVNFSCSKSIQGMYEVGLEELKVVRFQLIFLVHDLVDTILLSCQSDVAKQGLTLAEVKTKNCLDTLENLIGVKEDVIEDLFDKIDVNGDGIAHRHEMIRKSSKSSDGGC